MTISSVGSNLVTPAQLESMDIESAILAVQSDRVNNLDAQLQDQVKEVAKRNQKISDLNKLMNELRTNRPPDKATDEKEISADLYDKLIAAGCSPKDSKGNDLVKKISHPSGGVTVKGSVQDNKDTYSLAQSTFDAWNETLKTSIDSLSSTQQMDMLRLQSLSNKRNEAFEVMSSAVKKATDGKEFIINKW